MQIKAFYNINTEYDFFYHNMISNKDSPEIYDVACCEHSEHLRIDHKLKNLTGNCQGFQKEQKLSESNWR